MVAPQSNRACLNALSLLLALLITLPGCGGSGSGDSAAETPKLTDANEVLAKMTAAYKDAKTYKDAGTVTFTLRRGQEPETDSAPFSVAFERPAKLRMHLYQATVVSDGEQMHATIDDLPQQVFKQPLDGKLTPETLYSDEILAATLTQGIAGPSLQWVLLQQDKPLEDALTGAKKVSLLASESLDERPCYRVQIARPEGNLIFWVDEQTFVLRRAKFPTEELLKQFAAVKENADISSLELLLDFKGATLNGEIKPEAFQIELPADGKIVANFVPPPPERDRPQPPSKLLGKKVPEFKLTALDGTPVTQETLAGKITVLDFWFTECPNCFEAFPELTKVYEQYKSNDKIVFLAVNIDDATTHTNAQLEETFSKAGLTLPIVRDSAAHGDTVFGVEACPMTFILGADGTVESSEVGFNPNLAADLPAQLERLLAGESIHQDVQKQYEVRLREFEQSAAAPTGKPELPANEIAQKSDPTTLKLTKLWNSTELTKPGNILVVPDSSGSQTIYIHDGWHSVVQMGTDGKVVAKHEFEIPGTSVISYLRTAVDGAGKRHFVGSASTQQKLYVFDENMKQTLEFPDATHAGISDVQLADLDNDGQPEINISYYGVVGVQNFAMSGERRWNYRGPLENVWGLAIGSPAADGLRQLLCVNGTGTIIPLSATGEAKSAVAVKNRYLRLVRSNDLDGDGQVELCGLVPVRDAEDLAIGLTADGQELWSYELPRGIQQVPVEPISAGKIALDGASHWLLVAADGSIHILDAAGTLVDKFNYGVPVAGIATCVIDNQPALLVSTSAGVDAWQIGQ